MTLSTGTPTPQVETDPDTDPTDPGAVVWLLSGATAIGLSCVLGVGVSAIASSGGAQAETAAARAVAFLSLIAAAACSCIVLAVRPFRNPASLAVVLVGAASVALAANYFYVVGGAVLFRADILLWTEGEYVGDILKAGLGRPLYGAPADLSSFAYTPGSQLLTGLLARFAGRPHSIPTYRVLQLVYVSVGSLVALLTFRRLVLMRLDGRLPVPPWALAGAASASIFLMATNSLTNDYSHLLHNDALALCLSAVAYWLLVEFALNGTRMAAWGMACVPAAGFVVKQSLAIWAGLFVVYLVLFDRRLGWFRTLGFATLAFVLLAAVFSVGPVLWGKDFVYWTVGLMGNHPVSPLRSAQHVLDVWAYPVGLLFGGMLLLPSRRVVPLTGVWVVALGLFLVEAYTSGIAWMTNHMGPGTLLSGIWFLAGLLSLTPRAGEVIDAMALARSGVASGAIVLSFAGLGMIRIPAPWLPEDAHRYAREIEREFVGMDPRRVLLDYGSWVYMGAQVVPRDRAAPAGEAGYTGTADFSGFLARIRSREYERILVRGYGTGDFAYDHQLWKAPSGVSAALRLNYREVRRIEAVRTSRLPPWFKSISVLEPIATARSTP